MTVHSLNLSDMTAEQQALSEVVFSMYHPNPKKGQRSRVSDQFAVNVSKDEEAMMAIATCLAKILAPEHAEKIASVVGFYIAPVNEGPTILEKLLGMKLDPKPQPVEDQIVDWPLLEPVSGHINPLVLWAKAFRILQSHYSNVVFDHHYHEVAPGEFRPGIQGDGINCSSVNGALLQVLDDHDAISCDLAWMDFMATTDDDGWVWSAN